MWVGVAAKRELMSVPRTETVPLNLESAVYTTIVRNFHPALPLSPELSCLMQHRDPSSKFRDSNNSQETCYSWTKSTDSETVPGPHPSENSHPPTAGCLDTSRAR